MEWNSEHTQLQLTRVSGAAQSIQCISRTVISPQKLYEQLRHCLLSCFIILARYPNGCWLIIRCFVQYCSLSKARLSNKKTRVQLRKTVVQSSASTNLNVLDGRNQCQSRKPDLTNPSADRFQYHARGWKGLVTLGRFLCATSRLPRRQSDWLQLLTLS